jgi:rhodanese-related sulfurtransferase
VRAGTPTVRRVLSEALGVAVVGAVLALAANALSPRGLRLARDYFPEPRLPLISTVTTNAARPGAATNGASAFEQLSERLKQKGLRAGDSNLVLQLFHDPRVSQGLIAFVDARDEQQYLKGHVPGAHLFDYYHPERHLAELLPACQVAEKIVVYCYGGDCEDSELAATFLRNAGVPAEKLVVYLGGMGEWITNGCLVEIGERNSGTRRLLYPPQPEGGTNR